MHCRPLFEKLNRGEPIVVLGIGSSLIQDFSKWGDGPPSLPWAQHATKGFMGGAPMGYMSPRPLA